MYGRQNIVVRQEDINKYNCSESFKIGVARGCWGIFPCFSKKVILILNYYKILFIFIFFFKEQTHHL